METEKSIRIEKNSPGEKTLSLNVEKEKNYEEFPTVCPECGSRKLVRDYERAEIVCDDCGLVIDDNLIDHRAEYRICSPEQTKKIHYAPELTKRMHDGASMVDIGWRGGDFTSKKLSNMEPESRARLIRMRTLQKRIKKSIGERNSAFALTELDRISSILGIPKNTRENAALMYRKIAKKGLVRGRSIEGVVASVIYAACRQDNIPRTLDEIADVSRVTRREIGRTYRFICAEAEIKLPPTKPLDYIPRFCSILHLDKNIQIKASEILMEIERKDILSGRGPTGVAAAAIYIASLMCNQRITQREIAIAIGVTEVTIRNRYKDISKIIGFSCRKEEDEI